MKPIELFMNSGFDVLNNSQNIIIHLTRIIFDFTNRKLIHYVLLYSEEKKPIFSQSSSVCEMRNATAHQVSWSIVAGNSNGKVRIDIFSDYFRFSFDCKKYWSVRNAIVEWVKIMIFIKNVWIIRILLW